MLWRYVGEALGAGDAAGHILLVEEAGDMDLVVEDHSSTHWDQADGRVAGIVDGAYRAVALGVEVEGGWCWSGLTRGQRSDAETRERKRNGGGGGKKYMLWRTVRSVGGLLRSGRLPMGMLALGALLVRVHGSDQNEW
jgi:hypothetical protein